MLSTDMATNALFPFSVDRCVSAGIFHLSRQTPDDRPTVIGDIVLTINVTADNALDLHEHVVKSGRHGPCASAVADATAPADLDRMGRWVG